MNEELTADLGRAPLERDLQAYLSIHLETALGEKLALVRTEYPLPVGRVDILATDWVESLVAIELKIGVAGREAIGQLQSYIGALQQEQPDKFVRGILIAAALDSGGQAALRVARDIQFISFAVNFSFKAEDKAQSTYGEWAGRRITKVWVPEGFKR